MLTVLTLSSNKIQVIDECIIENIKYRAFNKAINIGDGQQPDIENIRTVDPKRPKIPVNKWQ